MAKKKKPFHRKWSEDEEKLLKEIYPIKRRKKVAKIMGRSLGSISAKVKMMGLKSGSPEDWTDYEIQLLKRLFPIKQTKEIAKMLGRTVNTVTYRAYTLSLNKEPFARR